MSDEFDFEERMRLIQNSLNHFTEKADRMRETGEAGGGLVKVTVNGRLLFMDVEIDPVLLSEGKAETLKTLIVSAANSAIQKVRDSLMENPFMV